MSLFDPISNYCERLDAGFWAEPLNAVSNIAFFIAAWLLYKTYRTNAAKDPQVLLLIGLLTLVGVGSTLFHTFANGLTMLFDIIPIALFTFYYLWVALRRLVGLTKLKATAALIVFILVASQMPNLPAELRFNNSADYFPCLAALLIIGLVLKARHHESAQWLLKAALCFALSLTLRSLDYTVCPAFPIGTHFLWHCLNGAVLYLLVRALLNPSQRTVN